ncbi:hypothetical protein [Leptothermofonsia sp. ETS-13]|uniref:hypothetical protein n=1 Tax=Leptothermofonsia sp. ETS-13 TaxID=3035696 RepID=UPI003BA25E6C
MKRFVKVHGFAIASPIFFVSGLMEVIGMVSGWFLPAFLLILLIGLTLLINQVLSQAFTSEDESHSFY